MKKGLKRVLIMAGGTGGHVFPALALAKYLSLQDVEVHWLGTASGLEARIALQSGFPLHQIAVAPLRGKGFLKRCHASYRLSGAIMQSLGILRKVRPDMVIGMGGFASGPGGIASWLMRYPLIIHEQNAKPGLTNRYLAHVADKVIAGFQGTFTTHAKKLAPLGNPVRAELEELPAPKIRFKRKHAPLRLLVIGGSLGASVFNELVPQALAKLPQELRPLVYHQTGDKNFAVAEKLYKAAGVSARLMPFITEMGEAYTWADMVLCRAGALTIAELCAVGLGGIFIPYPHAVDDHQTANAHFMVQHKAGILIPQSELTADFLAEKIGQIISAPLECAAMAEAAYTLRRVKVVEKIFELMVRIVNGKD